MIFIYEKQIVIKEDYIDMNKHVNNVIFLQLMQDVAIEHSDINGFTVEKYSTLKTSWIAKKHCINYLKPVLFNDKIMIRTWIKSISRFSAIRKYEFINIKDNCKVCEAESTWIYINQKNGKPCKIDENMKKSFSPFEENKGQSQ